MAALQLECVALQAARMTRTWQSIALFPIPSIIYWVHNNVQVRRQCASCPACRKATSS